MKALGVLFGMVLAVAGVFLFGYLLWWLWSRREEDEEAQVIELEVEALAVEAEEEMVEEAVAEAPVQEAEVEEEEAEEAPEPDDLKRIEGIGPKIASVLQAGGIVTYAQLAEADEEQLKQILEASDPRLLRLARPASWPEQAALAAAGEWEALGALQGELKGGRRA